MLTHIKKNQNLITITLVILFTTIIIFESLFPELSLENSLLIITGWLGIIIGFFFNERISDAVLEELEKERKDKQTINTMNIQLIKTLREEIQDSKETVEKISHNQNLKRKKTRKK